MDMGGAPFRESIFERPIFSGRPYMFDKYIEKGQNVSKALGFPIDSNIEGLVIYLNQEGAVTSNSCGHEGSVDLVGDKSNAVKAMNRLRFPHGSWEIVDYRSDLPPNRRKGIFADPAWVLHILGARPNTPQMWNIVQEISNKAQTTF